jgi:hypothetical protein
MHSRPHDSSRSGVLYFSMNAPGSWTRFRFTGFWFRYDAERSVIPCPRSQEERWFASAISIFVNVSWRSGGHTRFLHVGRQAILLPHAVIFASMLSEPYNRPRVPRRSFWCAGGTRRWFRRVRPSSAETGSEDVRGLAIKPERSLFTARPIAFASSPGR